MFAYRADLGRDKRASLTMRVSHDTSWRATFTSFVRRRRRVRMLDGGKRTTATSVAGLPARDSRGGADLEAVGDPEGEREKNEKKGEKHARRRALARRGKVRA